MITPEQETEYAKRWAEIQSAATSAPSDTTKDMGARGKVIRSIESGHKTSSEIAADIGVRTTRVCMTLKRMLDRGEVRVAGMLKKHGRRPAKIYEVVG